MYKSWISLSQARAMIGTVVSWCLGVSPWPQSMYAIDLALQKDGFEKQYISLIGLIEQTTTSFWAPKATKDIYSQYSFIYWSFRFHGAIVAVP